MSWSMLGRRYEHRGSARCAGPRVRAIRPPGLSGTANGTEAPAHRTDHTIASSGRGLAIDVAARATGWVLAGFVGPAARHRSRLRAAVRALLPGGRSAAPAGVRARRAGCGSAGTGLRGSKPRFGSWSRRAVGRTRRRVRSSMLCGGLRRRTNLRALPNVAATRSTCDASDMSFCRHSRSTTAAGASQR